MAGVQVSYSRPLQIGVNARVGDKKHDGQQKKKAQPFICGGSM